MVIAAVADGSNALFLPGLALRLGQYLNRFQLIGRGKVGVVAYLLFKGRQRLVVLLRGRGGNLHLLDHIVHPVQGVEEGAAALAVLARLDKVGALLGAGRAVALAVQHTDTDALGPLDVKTDVCKAFLF